MRDSDPTLSPLQKALLEYEQSDLEKRLIDWVRANWAQAARSMVYARKEAENTVSGVGQIRSDEGKLVLEVAARVAIAERELVARAIADVLPQWLEDHYDLTPKAKPAE